MATSLLDPRSTSFQVASSAVMGAWALVDPNRPTRRGQIAYRVGSAAAVGASVWIGARDEEGEPLGDGLRAALAAGSAVGSLALMRPSERLDARWHNFLRRRGIRHPRVLSALFTVGMYAATHALERWTEKQAAAAEEFEFVLEPVDERLRALVMAILEQTEDHGSLALRAQLGRTQRVRTPGEREVAAWVPFDVEEGDGPRAVPASAIFPIRARYATRRGALDLQVQVEDGVLSAVSWELVDSPELDLADDTFDVDDVLGDTNRWPSADEVLLLAETSRGLEPVVR